MDNVPSIRKVKHTQLDAWPVILSLLIDIADSDDVVTIAGFAGLRVDCQVTGSEAYSHSTRKRAYRPRIDAAYANLPAEDRQVVCSLIAADLGCKYPAKTQNIKIALARIGWTLTSVSSKTKTEANEMKEVMKRDKILQRLLLCELRDDKRPSELANYSESQQVYNAALLVDDGYVNGQAIRDGSGAYASVVMTELTSRGHDFLDEMECASRTTESNTVSNASGQMQISPIVQSKLIFISHSGSDQDLAESLVDMLCAALHLRRTDFLCTSVDGARLPGGADTASVLRNEICNASAFLSLLTPGALKSIYVLFELGARWGTGKHHIPLLGKGADASVLKEPLKSTNALQLSEQNEVLQLVEDLAKALGRSAEPVHSYLKKAQAVTKISCTTSGTKL